MSSNTSPVSVYSYTINKRNNKVPLIKTNTLDSIDDSFSDEKLQLKIGEDNQFYIDKINIEDELNQKKGLASIENKLNKLIWLFVGIILLLILSIILFWSLIFTCYYCMNLYHYITSSYLELKTGNSTNNVEIELVM